MWRWPGARDIMSVDAHAGTPGPARPRYTEQPAPSAVPLFVQRRPRQHTVRGLAGEEGSVFKCLHLQTE